jgi:hypothetical protein
LLKLKKLWLAPLSIMNYNATLSTTHVTPNS